jgi:hypothetical protein
LGGIRTFRAELAAQISAKNNIFSQDVDTLEIKAKADMLAFLAYIQRGGLFICSLAQ